MKAYKTLHAVVTPRTLTAEVRYQDDEKRQRRATVTAITIRYGGDVLGKATLGGRYSQRQAMDEFRRFPIKFGHCVETEQYDSALNRIKVAKPIPTDETVVLIYLGPQCVATGHLPGNVDADTAFALFDSNPESFFKTEVGWPMAQALGLVRSAA